MYYQLLLLFISFCAYAADVAPIDEKQLAAHITCQKIEGIDNIIFTRGDTIVTFPAKILTKSTVLNDMITSCSDAKEDPQKAFIQAASWFFDNIAENDIPLVTKLLQQIPEPFQEDIILSDGSSVHYKKAFKSELHKNAMLPEADRIIIGLEREKHKAAKDFIEEIARPLFETLSTEQIMGLLYLSDQFDIKSMYNPLIKHVAKHDNLWPYITNNGIAYDIVKKIDFESLHYLQDFLHINRPCEKWNVDGKNKNTQDLYKNLTTEAQQIIKQHLPGYYIVEANPINPHEMLIASCKNDHKTYLVINQETNQYYTLQAPWPHSKGTYNQDGKTIKLSARRSSNNAYEDIYIFDLESKKVLFEGNGKANNCNTIVYGLQSSDSQYRFHCLDTQKVYTPWPEPLGYIKFSPDKKTFAAKHNSETVVFYNIHDLINSSSCPPVELKVFQSLANKPIVYNADGSEFLIINNNHITLYDRNTFKAVGVVPTTNKTILKAHYSQNNKQIIIQEQSLYSNYTYAYHHLNLRQLPLNFIIELANAFKMHWKYKQPYTINNEEQLIKFHTMVPDLLIDDRFFIINNKIQEQFKSIIKENLEDTLGADAQHFNTTDVSQETLKLWHKAQQHWQENNKKPYELKNLEVTIFLNSTLPLEVALRLFDFDNRNSSDKQILRNLALTSIKNLKLPLNQSSINALLDSYGISYLPYFILALKHFQSSNKPCIIPDCCGDTFLHVKKVTHNLPILNRLFETHFDYSLISKNVYLLQIEYDLHYNNGLLPWRYLRYFRLKSEKSIINSYDILNKFDKPTLQFLFKANLAWKNKNPHPLETQEDLDHCFAFNQELNKEKHTPIAQELRSHNLFALSGKATKNVREKYARKIYGRLRSKQIIKRDHMSLFNNLTLDQLNMLFKASYQQHQLKQEELDAYYQLPDACKTEKLFDQDIINRASAAKRRELAASRPSRLAESFANIAYNVKKILIN